MAIFDIPCIPESIKKRALRNLLQRYLGNFLLEKLTLDQLSLDLYQGTGAIRKIQLDVDTINDKFNHTSTFKFIDGQINELSVFIPWASLMTEDSKIHFEGISLNLCKLTHKRTDDPCESNLSSLSQSLTTPSLQIAEAIINEEKEKFDGLEMFAQLIDSVLRRFKVSAENTSFKFVIPRKTGDGQEIEIRIKYIKCEEDEHIGDDDQNDESIVSQAITKIISLEGIEIIINSVSVSKISGRHSLRLKIDENTTDLQIIFGSHIFAIINSKHLETLIELFECGERMPHELSPITGEKLMNSGDYLRVEQQLHLKSGNCCANYPNTVISSTSSAMETNRWTACELMVTDDKPSFLPLKKHNDNRLATNPKDKNAKSAQFSCHLQIPGLTVCLLCGDSMPRFEGMPILETQNSFPRINSFLDKILDNFDHLRFISLQLALDVESDSVSFTCGDLMVGEVIDKKLSTVLWSRVDNQTTVNPFLRFKSRANSISATMNSINLRLDPTFLERYDKYFFVHHKNSSQNNSGFDLSIICEDITAELLFPIPDLRAQEERTFTQLRDESLRLKLTKSVINISQNGGQIDCQTLGIDFKVDDEFVDIANGHSSDSKRICLKFRVGDCPPLAKTLTDEELNQLYDAEMEDSIYVGQTAPKQVTEPFQVKRKVIGRDANENEVLTPGDRVHLEKYLQTKNSFTQLYFELDVPTADIRLQNKEQFELLYRRIANDLIRYIPYKDPTIETSPDQYPPTFFSCKNTSMSDSMSTNSSFHSQTMRSNFMGFVLNVCDITFEMGSKELKPQEVFGQKLMLGVVVGDSTSSLCLCCENLSLKTGDAVVMSGNIYSEPNCQFKLALDINRESDLLKKIKIAFQLSCATMYGIQIEVFEQFWKFINVTEEAVIGYIPPEVITELHIDLLDSAIALESLTTRPALITFEDIYLTSMIAENTNPTLLRIFAEETLFCLKRNKTSIEALKNYICVIQTGIIDINLKLLEDGKFELKVSNNAIDVRVCADSLASLCQIITSLTANTATINDTESVISDTDTDSMERIDFDGLMEGAMGDTDRAMDTEEDGDEEPPKFFDSPDSLETEESGFCILDDDLGSGITQTSEPQIRVLREKPFHIIENHFDNCHQKLIPDIIPQTIYRYFLEKMTLILHLFDGKDFDDDLPSDNPVKKSKPDDTKSYKSHKSNYSSEPRVRFTEGSLDMWENIDLDQNSLRPSHSNQNIGATDSFKSMGGVKRQTDTCVLICLNKVKTLFENFEEDFDLSWRFLFMVEDLEIIDRVMASKIKKMLYEYCTESKPRRKRTNMISVKATTFRSIGCKDESELEISVKPLRINIDQDTLLFMEQFFATVVATLSSEADNPLSVVVNSSPVATNIPTYEEAIGLEDNLSINSEVSQTTSTTTTVTTTNSTRKGSDSMNKVFFRLFSFTSDVPISLDYHGKHVDFDRGALQGLFLGWAQLNRSELTLKRLHNKHGLLGIDKVLSYAVSEWTNDIKANQLPSLLGGIGPMHSVIQLVQGICDLVSMPIDQYKRDKSLVTGLQRGAHSFSSSTAMATLDLANGFVSLIQSWAQLVQDVVTPSTPGHRPQSIASMSGQPRDLIEGLAVALDVVTEGFYDTNREVTSAGMASEDMSGRIGGFVGHIQSALTLFSLWNPSPQLSVASAIVQPIIIGTQATTNVIVGIRNQLTPEARTDDHNKYKNATER